MSSCEIIALVNALAIIIADCNSPEEIALIATTLSQLAATLGTILANEELKKPKTEGVMREPALEEVPDIFFDIERF